MILQYGRKEKYSEKSIFFSSSPHEFSTLRPRLGRVLTIPERKTQKRIVPGEKRKFENHDFLGRFLNKTNYKHDSNITFRSRRRFGPNLEEALL